MKRAAVKALIKAITPLPGLCHGTFYDEASGLPCALGALGLRYDLDASKEGWERAAQLGLGTGRLNEHWTKQLTKSGHAIARVNDCYRLNAPAQRRDLMLKWLRSLVPED